MIKKIWRFLWTPSQKYALATVLLGGIVVGVVGWGGFNWAMELSNTETFCRSCHEMEQNVYREFKGSVHDANASGVRATCPDCHVPDPWVYKVVRKVQATNELFHHFAGTIDTREKFEAKRLELAEHVWDTMKKTDSRECRNCHNFLSMDVTVQSKRARERHLEAQDAGRTCIDCHKGIAHELPEGALAAEQKLRDEEQNGKPVTQGTAN